MFLALLEDCSDALTSESMLERLTSRELSQQGDRQVLGNELLVVQPSTSSPEPDLQSMPILMLSAPQVAEMF